MSTAAISLQRAARHNVLASTGVVLVTIFVVCAVFAPLIAPQDPARIDLPTRLAGPSSTHWCGTDELGRDILSRLIYGSRISMLVGSCVVAASLALGLIVGSIAGYYGGRIDRFVNVVVMNAFLSFPGILLAIAFVAFRGPGIFNLVLALSLGGWVGYARLVRAQVLAARERGKEHEMRRVEQMSAAVVEHGAPAGGGWRHAEPEKAHGGFGEDGARHADGGLHYDWLNNVGQDVTNDHAQIACAQGAGGFHEFTLTGGEHLGANQAGVADPASEGKR